MIMVTVVDRILDVVAGGVDEHSTVIPSARLHSCVFMNAAEGLKLSGADGDNVLAQQGHSRHVCRPDHVPALGDLHTSHVPLLLHVKESHCIRISEKKHAGAGIEDLVAVGRRDLLGHLVLQVLHHQAV
jgi:hypothetical protein